MLFGIQIEVFEDTKSRKLLHVKKKDLYYQITKSDEAKVFLFSKGLINAVSLALIFGLILRWPIWAYVVTALVIYAFILYMFNDKVLPKMPVVNAKTVARKEAPKKDRSFSIAGIAYLVIAFGLLYCFFTNQVEEGMMTYVVIGAIAISLVMGAMNLFTYGKKKRIT